MRQTIDPAKAETYPPNIQAILKRVAPCSMWLGQELLEIDTETGFARVAYGLGESHFNRFGALHGGAIACVMDDVLAIAAGLVLQWGEIAPTLEMKVSFLSQGRAGRHIAEAQLRKRGRQVNFLEATLFDATGKTIATASATIMVAALQKS
ncbi:MAG: PaaI family thioesterase [Alphaproteobacteria bacterium]|nr:PaaI family thioesterase [Alphaproteobacteria bacterium]MBV9694813.1 PaaI family thioesterase [Alphaproteobacteria bacterium]